MRWDGFHIVMYQNEPVRNILAVLAQDAREEISQRMGKDWTELAGEGYEVRKVDLWSA